jgi:hypothetical protein
LSADDSKSEKGGWLRRLGLTGSPQTNWPRSKCSGPSPQQSSERITSRDILSRSDVRLDRIEQLVAEMCRELKVYEERRRDGRD